VAGRISLGVKRAGERSAGNPPAPFDVAGVGDGFTAGLVRHSRRKRGATDRLGLRNTAPALDPTGERLGETAGLGRRCALIRLYRRPFGLSVQVESRARFNPPRQDSGVSLPRRLDRQNSAKLVSFRGTTGDTGRLAPLVVLQEKMDMAKATLLEPQRLSVMLAVVSPAIGTMGPNAVLLSGANSRFSAQERGAVRYPEFRSQQVCIAEQNVNEGPTSIEQMRKQLPEKSEGMVNPVRAGMPLRRQSSHSSDEAGQRPWSEGEQDTRGSDEPTRGQDLT